MDVELVEVQLVMGSVEQEEAELVVGSVEHEDAEFGEGLDFLVATEKEVEESRTLHNTADFARPTNCWSLTNELISVGGKGMNGDV